MHAWLDWLSTLPTPLLYTAIFAAAFAENLFPPLPSDTVVALGAFVAARGHTSPIGAWFATISGCMVGAMTMFMLGRRVGVAWLSTRFPRVFPADAMVGVADRFRSHGFLTIAVSRFLPGVRAVVPPVAGAIGIGTARAAAAMALASGIWYGIVCTVAYQAGENADEIIDKLAAQQRWIGAVSLALLLLLIAYVAWRRRRASRDAASPS